MDAAKFGDQTAILKEVDSPGKKNEYDKFMAKKSGKAPGSMMEAMKFKLVSKVLDNLPNE